jgi:Flp pilus assembly pilin Flp
MTTSDHLKVFITDESGAVTVDWVVLTAAIVGLGIAVIGAISSGVGGLGGGIERSLLAASIDPIDLNAVHGGGGAGGDDDEG